MTGPLTVAPGSRLTHAGTTRYEYDGYGNRILEVTGDEEQHYEWDTEHRLTGYRCRVRGQETVHYRYQYDALGRRILKEDLLTRTARRFFWQGERLLCECDAGRFWPGRLPDNPQLQEALRDTTHRVWLYEDEHDFRPLLMLCGRETNPGVYHYVCDHLGTPLEMRDVRGRVVWSAMLRSYGQVHHADTAGINQPLRFQGQYHDAESGLYYNRHRYYDPGVGRYLSPDPVGLAGGLNQYAYVPDPLKYIDPLGLCKVDSARARQAQMLQDDVGYNISPKSWDQFPEIGRDGTFVTDKDGALKYFNTIQNGEVTISKSLAATIEEDIGLSPGSLSDRFNIRRIDGISNMQPRSPLKGNDYFLGPGQHLPGGAPEMVINSVPTSTPVTIRVNVN